jgi:hypothetical protein
VIPSNLINPISTKLMGLLPARRNASTSGSNNYFALLPFHKDTLSYDVKVDYVPTEKDRLSVRLSYSRPEIFQAPAFAVQDHQLQRAIYRGTPRRSSQHYQHAALLEPE